MREIGLLEKRLREEMVTRIDDCDIVDILEVLQLADETIKELESEKQWLYGKLNTIRDTIERTRHTDENLDKWVMKE